MAVIALGPADAADMQLEPEPLPRYGETREYYSPRVEERYVERYVYRAPPPVYAYPPPPVAYYAYAPPPVTVLPEVYYLRRPYRAPAYVVRGYQPRIVRGYARYDRRWAGGHRRW